MSDVNRNKLRSLAAGARDAIIRSHGWEGTIEEAILLQRDKHFLKELSPEAVIQLLDDYDALLAERDQLRAERAAIRGQEPVAWCVPVAGEYEIGVDREKVQFQRDMYERIMSDEIEHEEAQPLYALPPQQPDAVSVSMSDDELDALWREIQDTAMREPGLPHLRFARAVLAAKVDDAVSVPRDLLEWAVERWHEEVSQRPLANVHRRTLDDTWRQIITKLGGDHGLLCGPRHDALLSTRQAEEGE